MSIEPLRAVSLARVAISSPSDVASQRDLIERTIYSWNQQRSEETGITYLTLRWERDVTPGLTGLHPQTSINKAIVAPAHAMFAIFGSRVGTATPSAISGTVEEIEEASSAGLVPHVFFSKSAIPRDHDQDQLKRLRDYRESLLDKAVIADFRTKNDLVSLVDRSLTSDARKMTQDSPDLFSPRVGSALRASVDRTSARDAQLVLANVGPQPVENLQVKRVDRKGIAVNILNLGRVTTLGISDTLIYSISSRVNPGDELEVTISSVLKGVLSTDSVRVIVR